MTVEVSVSAPLINPQQMAFESLPLTSEHQVGPPRRQRLGIGHGSSGVTKATFGSVRLRAGPHL